MRDTGALSLGRPQAPGGALPLPVSATPSALLPALPRAPQCPMGSCANERPGRPQVTASRIQRSHRLTELFRQGTQRGLRVQSEPLVQVSQQDGAGVGPGGQGLGGRAAPPAIACISCDAAPLSPAGMLRNMLMPGPPRVLLLSATSPPPTVIRSPLMQLLSLLCILCSS